MSTDPHSKPLFRRSIRYVNIKFRKYRPIQNKWLGTLKWYKLFKLGVSLVVCSLGLVRAVDATLLVISTKDNTKLISDCRCCCWLFGIVVLSLSRYCRRSCFCLSFFSNYCCARFRLLLLCWCLCFCFLYFFLVVVLNIFC